MDETRLVRKEDERKTAPQRIKNKQKTIYWIADVVKV